MEECAVRVRVGQARGFLWQMLRRQEGVQTMEWILLIALVGTVVLGLMKWFGDHENTVGQAVWGLVRDWLEKARPADS